VSGRDRALGVAIGIVLGLALIVLFVFVLGDVIDSPSLD
jgi:uncharacterized membrane protein required for colicin V production